jgi:hypothetical protein
MSELRIYFAVVVPLATLLLALPITLAPLSWARALRWRVPDTDVSADERYLTLYFARCLGVIALAFGIVAGLAGIRQEVPEILVLQAILMGAGLTLVHAYGAVRRMQPITETIEIGVYAGLTLWALSLYVRFY